MAPTFPAKYRLEVIGHTRQGIAKFKTENGRNSKEMGSWELIRKQFPGTGSVKVYL